MDYMNTQEETQTVDTTTTENATAQDTDAQLKAKYGKVYRIGVAVPVDDDSENEFAYRFKRPSVPSYDRYIKSMSKHGATKASKAFLLDSVVDEDKERLIADMEEYPGVAFSISNKLTDILGLTDANLKAL
ncbi:MAG: hypothetical protein LUG13_02750 [Oscillospiraceae bacterium]|nr:hypothetical protein [Oscillospiraceae bacterium]